MWKKSDFLSRKKEVMDHLRKRGVSIEEITTYCGAAAIPLTVVYSFVMEEFPEHRSMCIRKIKELNEFYGIKDDSCDFCEVSCSNDHCVNKG